MNYSAADIIEKYQLQPHPEGGYYKEMYRSNVVLNKDALPQTFNGDRNIATSIYFLLEGKNFSAFHRIKSDETWHFYAGETLLIYVIDINGNLDIIKLGNTILNEDTFQYTVPAGCWFASKPAGENSYCFVGCTVYPGFDFADFEMAERTELSTIYPQHVSVIKSLTR